MNIKIFIFSSVAILLTYSISSAGEVDNVMPENNKYLIENQKELEEIKQKHQYMFEERINQKIQNKIGILEQREVNKQE